MKVVDVTFDVIPAVNRFVVVTAFAAYRLFPSERLDRFETCQTFRVPTFAVVDNKLVVVTAFETYTLPVTLRLVRPVRPAMVCIPVAVTLVVKTFVVVTAFDA